MLKKLALAGAAAIAISAPAHAVTIKFEAGVSTLPAWTTATIVQDFDDADLVAGQPFKTGEADSLAITETISGGPGSSAVVSAPSGFMASNYLTLSNSASYRVDFGSAQQFVGFLISDYKTSNSLTINGVATNLLTGVTGLTAGASGLFYIDMGGATGISSITFASVGNGAGNRMQIDQIASAAPEAATWGMMILGFGVVGMQIRRRRSEDRAAALA